MLSRCRCTEGNALADLRFRFGHAAAALGVSSYRRSPSRGSELLRRARVAPTYTISVRLRRFLPSFRILLYTVKTRCPGDVRLLGPPHYRNEPPRKCSAHDISFSSASMNARLYLSHSFESIDFYRGSCAQFRRSRSLCPPYYHYFRLVIIANVSYVAAVQ